MKWQASAPSNIALIKYMGKTDHKLNLPSNVSFSYTVDHLRTFVELEMSNSENDSWEPLVNSDVQPLELNEKSQQRYLNFLGFLKDQFHIKENFLIKSANNFPAACGIASSASSFAALTLCFAETVKSLSADSNVDISRLNQLSRQGSGSSCRSFYSGWVRWEKDVVEKIELPYENLIHLVSVAGDKEKDISTSEAHKVVSSSLLFEGRTVRAEKRYDELMGHLEKRNWREAYEVSWNEFWDMHSLFETSQPNFGYMNAGSLEALSAARKMWKKENDGPIVTMDAGPNVHFFFREDQDEMVKSLNSELSQNFKVLSRESFER